MRRHLTSKLALSGLALLALAGTAVADEPIRVIVFGAHPDDCELDAGGTAARWAKLGHKVKFVATTNGDIGHHKISGGPLAQRRTAEVKKCAEILGIATELELESMDAAFTLAFHERLHAGRRPERHGDVQRQTVLQHATEQHRGRLVRDAPEDVPAGDIDGALRVLVTAERGVHNGVDGR